jgi:hypothetical protein
MHIERDTDVQKHQVCKANANVRLPHSTIHTKEGEIQIHVIPEIIGGCCFALLV